MTLKFSCAECGKHLRAPDDAAGRPCRCPDCSSITTVPHNGSPPLPSVVANSVDAGGRSQSPTRGNAADTESGAVLGLPKSTARNVRRILGVGVIAIAGIVYYGYSSRHKKLERRHQLIHMVDEQIDAAAHTADKYDFAGAKDVLIAAATQVSDSPYANDLGLVDELDGKIDAARSNLQRRENDYRDKVRKGWLMFEGKFVPGSEKHRILAQRRKETQEAERRRQQQARRRREEESRRRAAALLVEQQHREAKRQKQIELLKKTAYLMSQEFVKNRLKAPSSARFPRYASSNVSVTYDEEKQKYVVTAWVEAQNPFGVYLRSTYICRLWPAGGDTWQMDLTSLN